jgi:hypothetical protein
MQKYKMCSKSSVQFNFKLITCILVMSYSIQCISQTDSFLKQISGSWRGNMEISVGPRLVQTVPMQLRILPTDTIGVYTYRIIYGLDTVAGDRPYLIRTVNEEKGYYIIDEQNSIKIESYRQGNSLTSAYEVEGNLIFDILELRQDELIWSLMSGKGDPVSSTGDTTYKGEKIPIVKTYPIGVLQRAVLKR